PTRGRPAQRAARVLAAPANAPAWAGLGRIFHVRGLPLATGAPRPTGPPRRTPRHYPFAMRGRPTLRLRPAPGRPAGLALALRARVAGRRGVGRGPAIAQRHPPQRGVAGRPPARRGL